MNNKIILFILFLMSSIKVFSAAQDPCLTCRNDYNGSNGSSSQIGYYFCDPVNNVIVPLCTAGDPYNLPSPYTGWKPMKLCLPLSYGTTVTYNNANEPWNNLGPWTEEIYPNQTDNNFAFKDSDIPSLITAAIGYWQNIDNCSSYNNQDCQSCSIKIIWTTDATKLGDDKLLPSHVNNPLTSQGCTYDCSKLAIILNGTSGFSNPNNNGLPNNYFFTEGSDANIGYGTTLVNTDLRTEIMHQLGILLGFANTLPDGDPGCGSPCSMMSEFSGSYTYLSNQENRITTLDATCNINNPYNFVHTSTTCNYDDCAFRLLYCCSTTDVQEDIVEPSHIFEIKPNPVNSKLNIQFSLYKPQNVDLGIYNLFGDEIISIISNKYFDQNVYNYEIDMNSIVSGSYFVILKEGDQIISKIFVLLQ